jgi:hypothetical protein
MWHLGIPRGNLAEERGHHHDDATPKDVVIVGLGCRAEPGMRYKGGNLNMRGAELAKIT